VNKPSEPGPTVDPDAVLLEESQRAMDSAEDHIERSGERIASSMARLAKSRGRLQEPLPASDFSSLSDIIRPE
jgi:hypothetical protein